MNRILVKMICVDSIVWIVVLSLVLISIYLAFLPQADAITRAEFDALKTQAREIEKDIAKAGEKLKDQQEKIKNHEKDIDVLKQKIRDVIGNGWDAAREKFDIEAEVTKATEKLSEYRDELGEIINERSELIRQLKILDVDNQSIEGDPLPDLTPKIGVILSKNCITMLQNNITSDCPSYKNMITLDSSDTDISGKFTTDENGFFHRGDSPVKVDCKFYDEDRLVIFVDPSTYCLDRIKLIVIENNFDTFTIPGHMVEHEKYEYVQYDVTNARLNTTETVDVFEKTSDFARVVYHDRFVDKNCQTATLNAVNMTKMLADTIHYMRSGCDESHTSFITKEIIPIERTVQNYTTTQDYKEKEFLKYVKEFCIFKFKSCD